MKKSRFTESQIIQILQEAEVSSDTSRGTVTIRDELKQRTMAAQRSLQPAKIMSFFRHTECRYGAA